MQHSTFTCISILNSLVFFHLHQDPQFSLSLVSRSLLDLPAFICIKILYQSCPLSLVSRSVLVLSTFTFIKILTSPAYFHLYQDPYQSCPLSLASRSLLDLSTFTCIKILLVLFTFTFIKILHQSYLVLSAYTNSPWRHRIISFSYRSVFTAVSQRTVYSSHSLILRGVQDFKTQQFTAILNVDFIHRYLILSPLMVILQGLKHVGVGFLI